MLHDIIERPVQQDVVVGSARLQYRLHARDVGMHRAEVVPQWIGRRELRRCVEEPAGPFGVGRRVHGAVIEDVIDAGGEQPVELRLRGGGRLAKILAQPGQRLTRDQRLAHDVRRRRSETPDGHRRRIRVDAHADRIAAQAHDRQLGQTEGFGLGNIRGAVQVEQVAGRAVRLVARLESFFMRPGHPRVHVVEMQFRERAPVVALDAAQRVVVERLLACRAAAA